ncbi:MAG: ParA family protein [Waddliaceae bacterium]|jgi:chromosome partitioning protein|nr:ParA family protein [Waddliaceae bacterium]MBT3579371.1 ParA family protein [Waddliaceae bacterium]MBT4444861.1 ParA family protein [Waddliaceae bacterium]MBT6928003.1 ParA family protein [Waddliaceae bacterium]MBT7264321.1 ParA family protein [Waddliaceae bacterium]
MKTIAVTSFKGGTAKTSTALHVGAALSRFHNSSVLLIDFDAQANMTTGLGFNPDEQESMVPVLQGQSSIKDVIQKTCINNLDLIPGDTWLERVEVTDALAADRYSHERLYDIIKDLNYDYIIIDTPPSLCWLTESALIAADYSLICATPEFYSIKGLERLASFTNSIAERHPLKIAGVALSFWNHRGKSNQDFLEVIENAFPGKIFNTKIRRDIAVSEASIFGKPLFETAPKSRASDDYKNLTEEIVLHIERLG